jgi:saccharopine dehydrogenase-like NADP-dependent oxidoreductase
MTISKAHQKFSTNLQKPEALTNPQYFLGPNYETVLNFWWTMDSLTETQWKEVARRYDALDYAASYAASSAAGYAAGVAAGIVAWNAAAGLADGANYAAWNAARYATYELIGMHTLLNDGRDLLFIPLFSDL